MKKLAWLFVILCSLELPNIFQSLWMSFYDNEWKMYSYNYHMTPRNTFLWLSLSAVLALAMVVTACWYHRKTMGATVAIVAGTAFSSFLYYSVLLIDAGVDTITDLYTRFDSWDVISLAIIGVLTALCGLAFGKPIVVPGGNSPAIRNILRPFLYLAEKIFGREKVRERTKLWWRMQA